MLTITLTEKLQSTCFGWEFSSSTCGECQILTHIHYEYSSSLTRHDGGTQLCWCTCFSNLASAYAWGNLFQLINNKIVIGMFRTLFTPFFFIASCQRKFCMPGLGNTTRAVNVRLYLCFYFSFVRRTFIIIIINLIRENSCLPKKKQKRKIRSINETNRFSFNGRRIPFIKSM